MIIENAEETLELLKNIDYFFTNIDETTKKLKSDLCNKECERDDLLHEIELSDLNIGERATTFKKLKLVLKERRIIKDKIEFLNEIKPYSNKFITKGICSETREIIVSLEKLLNNHNTRRYFPRVLKDLKCAKINKDKTNNE